MKKLLIVATALALTVAPTAPPTAALSMDTETSFAAEPVAATETQPTISPNGYFAQIGLKLNLALSILCLLSLELGYAIYRMMKPLNAVSITGVLERTSARRQPKTTTRKTKKPTAKKERAKKPLPTAVPSQPEAAV